MENFNPAPRAHYITFGTFQNDTRRARTIHKLSFPRNKIPAIIMFTRV